MRRRRFGLAGGLAVVAATFVADQATKAALLAVMEGRALEPLEITGFFRLVMVWNSGISFGMLSGGAELQRWLLTAFSIAVAAAIVAWMRNLTGRVPLFAAGLVAGGALGNAADRVVHGAVADFFDVHVGAWSWPAFNVADSAITIGVVLLLADALSIFGGGRRMSP